MIRVLVVLTLAMFAGGAALAQESRLDAIQKGGALRVCTPGDYKPFSLAKPDATFEGLDVEIAQSMAKALGVEAKFVRPAGEADGRFHREMRLAVGGISVTLDRQKRAFFSSPIW
jgi:cyclohexadienyl dehydratase